MKNQLDIREILIDNTICLIAEGGFEAATTKAITHSGGALPGIKMNEVYIYRLFGSKEHLYNEAFERLDLEFVHALRRCVSDYGDFREDTPRKLYKVFLHVWKFLLGNETRCRCYIRYYYSFYFKNNSLKRHNELFEEIVTTFSYLFKEAADVRSILHSVLLALFDFAVRVFNGDLQDLEINTPHVFNVVFYMMLPYLKDEIETKYELNTLVKEATSNE